MSRPSFLRTVAVAALTAAVFMGLAASLTPLWAADGITGKRVPVQAPATPPPVPAPEVAPPDGDAPLLTPDIRPRAADPIPKPDRKAEPAPAPPKQKDAQPDPKALPKADPKAPPGKSATKEPAKPRPGLAVAQPRTAAEREKALSDLYAYLATAEDAKRAETIMASIERLWVTPGSDTISLLMQRALHAANGKKPELALKLLDAVVALAPDYAEGWNRRAYVHYQQNDVDRALGDLRRTLALDPNHFKALEGLVHILKDIGRKKEALQAARQLLEVNPFDTGAKQIVDELAREIEGRGI